MLWVNKTVLVKLIFRKTVSPSVTNTVYKHFSEGEGLEILPSSNSVEKFLEQTGRKPAFLTTADALSPASEDAQEHHWVRL